MTRGTFKLAGTALLVAAALLPALDVAAATCFGKGPLDSLFITSNFGIRKHPKLQGVTRLHAGLDLRAAKFTKVYAVDSGLVQVSTYSPSAGNFVQILNDSGTVVRYLHHERNYVKTGDRVTAGQQIADSGNSGEASAAPHLHFEVKVNGSQPVDPRGYLCPGPPEKPGAGPDPTLNAGAPAPGTPGASTITNGVPNNNYPPMGATPTAAAAVPQSAGMPNYDGMSTLEFLARESTRRFTNPQWLRDLNDPFDSLRNHPDRSVASAVNELPIADPTKMLLTEIVFMQNLKQFYSAEKYERRGRIEHMLAVNLADRVNTYNELVMERTKRALLTTK